MLSYPREVRVANGTIEWHARLRDAAIPIACLRRVRANTMPQNAVVLESEGIASASSSRRVGRGLPWRRSPSPVRGWRSLEIVECFGSWSGKTNGSSVESLDSAVRWRLIGTFTLAGAGDGERTPVL